eukprot:s2384_g7.t1
MRRLRPVAEEGAQDDGQLERVEFSGPASHDPRDLGGVSGVPRVPPLEASTSPEEGARGGERLSNPECSVESKETSLFNRRQRRTLRQARKALDSAEGHWIELMSFLRTAPDQIESVGWSHFDSTADDRSSREKYLWLLQKTEKQARIVAELQEVRRYIQDIKPGLVVISPPCTLFSLLQNLTNRSEKPESEHRYLRRLIEAKVLLRFGIEIAFEVLKYGGTFVFEHPLTSRAWMETFMQKLINHPEVHMTVGDQCRYGLRAKSGVAYRKPTGFLSNNPQVIEQLGLRCDGTHPHEMVIGRDSGGLRSRQAQHYPAGLVEAILKGYKLSIGTPLTILWADAHELQRDRDRVQALQHQFAEVTEENAAREKFTTPIYAMEQDSDENAALDDDPASAENQHPEEIEVPAEDVAPEDDGTHEELYKYLPREKPFSLAQLVRRAHEGLGHPGNDRLARILKDAKASPQAIEIAKHLTCSVCEKHAATRPARRAAPPKYLHVNQIVGIDTIYLPDYRGKRRMALNIVD